MVKSMHANNLKKTAAEVDFNNNVLAAVNDCLIKLFKTVLKVLFLIPMYFRRDYNLPVRVHVSRMLRLQPLTNQLMDPVSTI